MTEQFKNYDTKGCLIEPKDVVKILYCESDRVVEVDQLYSVFTVGTGWIDVTVGENEWETMFPREVEVVKKHFEITGCLPDYHLEHPPEDNTGSPDNVSFSWSELGIAFTKSEDGAITVVPKEGVADNPYVKEDVNIRKHNTITHEAWNPNGVVENIEYIDGQVMYYGDCEMDDIIVDDDKIAGYDEQVKKTVVDFIKGMKESK